ncbi:MAG: ssDNA-binding protein [Pseudomonadota bacterium]
MFDNDGMLMIKDVRVSFPHLFTPPVINGEEGKCGAVLMLDPKIDAAAIIAIEARIDELIQEKLKGKKLPSDKLCLRDGDDKGRPEYEGLVVVSANNQKRPLVLNARAEVVGSEDDNPIYGGCRVNAKIQLWAQNNNYGKRVNATLIAIQFASDDEPLDGTHVPAEKAMSGFGEIADEDDPLAA